MQNLQPNTTLQGGKYKIERVLGQGGFGITYLATQESLNRKVAVKEFFMKDFCSRDDATSTLLTHSAGSGDLVSQYRKKFFKEARNLAKLNHPNIISVIDVFEENGTVYYVMPYLAGGSLQDYVDKHGVLSETEAMKYVKQVAGALKYMHEQYRLCHYDVKPANILLDEKGNAVLIDFGISKNYDGSGQETTSTPVGVSDGYAPIEQYQQDLEEFSPASDVYALGATLYFLLHGKRPVSAIHRASGTALLMSKHLSQGVKDIISASMKVSKQERVNSLNVFLGNQNYGSSSTVGSSSGGSSNSTFGWLIGIIVVVTIVLFIFNNQGGDKQSIQSPGNEVASDYKKEVPERAPKSDKYEWSGSYKAIKDVGNTYGGTPIFFETTFTLKKVREDYYVGTMEISGYQTMYDVAKIEGNAYNNRIRIFFKSSNDDAMNKWSDICTTNNAPLLTLTYSKGQIEAEWFATLCEADVVDQTTRVTKQ